MAIHKLDFDDFDEINFSLIAIHTSLEDYRLAYFINQSLHLNLKKSVKEIQIAVKEGEALFSRFHYYDEKKEISWDLIQNKNEVIHQQIGGNQDLFSNLGMEVVTKVFMLPELKKADFFLKIEHGEENLNFLKISNVLNTIDNIVTTYIVDINNIKSKNNLIF